MTTDVFDDWYDTKVSVATSLGRNDWGVETTDGPHDVMCLVTDSITLVRNADGEETTSSTQLFAALSDAVHFKPGSKVAWAGAAGIRRAEVISVSSAAGDPELDGITVNLT